MRGKTERMQLPNFERAIVPPEKLRDYILSSVHPIGRFKSTFFRGLGYGPESWERLATDIKGLLNGEAELTETTQFGKKYVVRGILTGPNGRSALVATVWIILNGRSEPRFVTAYPGA